SCMQEVVPAEVRNAAHMLARSAREIGAWRVAEAAAALGRAVVENREFASALWTFDCAVVEAPLAIFAMLRIQLSRRRPTSRPSAAPAQAEEGRAGKGEG